MKGQGMKEKLELQAWFLTKECERGVWCVLGFFLLFPSAQGPSLSLAKAGTEMLKP